MISKKLEEAINEQINKELYSEYLYLSMAAYFADQGLAGFENFFLVQVQEERFHAMKMYHFLNERGGRARMKQIDGPGTDFASPLAVFEKAYEHEQYVTSLINGLMDLAIKENDHASKSFLNWFIDEQVEEEASMESIVSKLKMIGGKGNGMLMLDKELAARTFVPAAE
ncbi:ferritin [bacterium]|nr:ferritin [bacterium]